MWRGTSYRKLATSVVVITGCIAVSCGEEGSRSGEHLGQQRSALTPGQPWFPVGPLGATPELAWDIQSGTVSGGPLTGFAESGRGTALAISTNNPNDVYLGTGAGLWWASNLPIALNTSVTPSVNPWFLAMAAPIGAVAVDPATCTSVPCSVVWVGTGEATMRRETAYGSGLFKLTPRDGPGFAVNPEPTSVSGGGDITNGTIGSLVLAGTTSAQIVYFTVSGGNTSSGNDATVFHPPPTSGFGVFKFDEVANELTQESVPTGVASTAAIPGDLRLATDGASGSPELVASFFNLGIYRKTLPGGPWCPVIAGMPAVSGCSAQSSVLPSPSSGAFDRIALAAFGQTVYASFANCTDRWSGNGGGVSTFQCPASIFVSTDGGATWKAGEVTPASTCPTNYDGCVYSNYAHALTVSPFNTQEMYHGGFFGNVSLNGGASFTTVLHSMHPDYHAMVVSPVAWTLDQTARTATAGPNGTQHLVYVANDGGLELVFVDPTSGANQNAPVSEPPSFQLDHINVLPSTTPCASGTQNCSTTAVIAGANDNGTVLYNGGRVWKTLSSADIGDVHFLDANSGLIAGYATQPFRITTATYDNLQTRVSFASTATDNDAQEFGKCNSTANCAVGATVATNAGTPSGPDGHGKMMLTPIARDAVTQQFYFATDRVYQIDTAGQTATPVSWRLLDNQGTCNRNNGTWQGSCDSHQACVGEKSGTTTTLACRNFYTDIEKIDAVSALAAHNGVVFAGMYSGRMFTNAGGTFAATPNPPTLRACDAKTLGTLTPVATNGLSNASRCTPITSIDFNQSNTNQVYVTVGGFGTSEHVLVFDQSTNAWSSLSDGAMSGNDLPAIIVRADPDTTNAPGHVLLGTQTGLFERTSTTPWQQVLSIPNVAVDDIAYDPSRFRAYVATHGFGAFMSASKPVVQIFAGWMDPSMCAPGQPCIWDLLVYGQGLQATPAGQSCTLSILTPGGDVCTQGTNDALSTNPITVGQNGMLTTKGQQIAKESDGKPIIAACWNGSCVNGTTTQNISACEPNAQNPTRTISAISLSCPNNPTVVLDVGKNCPQLQSPPATTVDLSFMSDPPPSNAPPVTSLNLVVQLDGMPMEALCSVSVPIFASDTHDAITDRARTALATSTTCANAGVQVLPKLAEDGTAKEDATPVDRLQVLAPGAVGRALYVSAITDPSAPGAPGLCERFGDFPGYATSQLDIMDTTFATVPSGARGGSISFTEDSPLGRCSVTVPTTPGETAAQIAQSVLAAYQAVYTNDNDPECPYSSNPGDMVASSPIVPLPPATLNTIAATSLEVCLNDTGVGVSVSANGVPIQDATLPQAALYATGTLIIKDGTKVEEPAGGFALVANAGSGPTSLSPSVSVGAIVSVGSVTLSDRDVVTGRIKTAGTITLGNGDTIGGPTTSSTSVSLPSLSQYQVQFPRTFSPGLTLQPGTSGSLPPGAYQATTVYSRATLSLTAGTYFFTSVDFEPQANVVLNDSAGPVVTYVQSAATLHGTFSSTRGGDPNLRLVYEGAGQIQLYAPFSGTVVAPNGTLDLTPANGGTYRGSFFGMNLSVVDANSTIVHLPPN